MSEDYQRSDERLVRIDDLRKCIAAVFERLNLAPEHADELAGLLVDSEIRGHSDHGIEAVALLANFYREGRLNPNPHVKVLSETDGALLLDGDGGCGPGAPSRAMRWCIERARQRKGMAVAAVRNWQCVVAGPYVRQAAEAGLIAFASTNFIPQMAPPGGRTRVLGTNPFAYGLPARRHPPVVIDMATTAVALQKIRAAAQLGEPVPENVILDGEGRSVTDPAEFFNGGLMAPLGHPIAGHKGFALAQVVDTLSGVLTGSGSARSEPAGMAGTFMWALDVEGFLPRDEFLERMDAQIDQIKDAERVPGVDEIVVPGERGERRRQRLTVEGVAPVSQGSWDSLSACCQSLGVPLPSAIGSNPS
jgi:LDH2 family malate/lactate/ureidoglycolate dehydrogenase